MYAGYIHIINTITIIKPLRYNKVVRPWVLPNVIRTTFAKTNITCYREKLPMDWGVPQQIDKP